MKMRFISVRLWYRKKMLLLEMLLILRIWLLCAKHAFGDLKSSKTVNKGQVLVE